MTTKQARVRKPQEAENFYSAFDQLDGRHPWMEAVPEGFVGYRVRELRQGRVAYFNFFLAKEMGLISADHPHEMTEVLEAKLRESFSLQIINEYDELTKRRIPPETIKKHAFMATRYLQLQHANKQGKTSGDGRGIWNGTVSHRGQIWDVSSRGTGVTCLAPGAVAANKPLKTGAAEFGYACGQAEIDELLGAAILAESMHLQGLQTERVLCVIDLGKGLGIGVRAALNLIRPAHLFLYLKQERLKELKAATDYLIDRQVKNRRWKITGKGNARYDQMCEQICDSFADFTAILDMDYIFAWLDWDGDNVLADAGIIDYGSVRQFGIRHDHYRYDDVERFSTNLNEQRQKARLIVQVFIQMADYLKTGQKKPLRAFAKHPLVEKFNKIFAERRAHRLLYRVGFNSEQRNRILAKHPEVFEKFDRLYSHFERAKVSGSPQRVPDGVNHPPLYNLRKILASLAEYYAQSKESFDQLEMPVEDFHSLMLSSFAKSKDLKMGEKHARQIQRFQGLYKKLLQIASDKRAPTQILQGLSQRAKKLNSDRRITGNALIEIVEEVLEQKRRGLPLPDIQKVVDRLIMEHVGFPEVSMSRPYRDARNAPSVRGDLYSKILSIVRDNRETI